MMLPTFLFLGLINWAGVTFVTTIMYARDTTFAPAWSEFRQKISRACRQPDSVPAAVDGAALGIAMAGHCLAVATLCLGFLPYLNCVVALPLIVFIRSYAIYYLQQFGPEYVIMSEPPPRDYGFPVIMPPLPLPPVG